MRVCTLGSAFKSSPRVHGHASAFMKARTASSRVTVGYAEAKLSERREKIMRAGMKARVFSREGHERDAAADGRMEERSNGVMVSEGRGRLATSRTAMEDRAVGWLRKSPDPTYLVLFVRCIIHDGNRW